jgi:alginate O-acetyltransferase complex protein AlgI
LRRAESGDFTRLFQGRKTGHVLFNSLEFLIFLPIVLTAYFLLDHRRQNYLLLAASLFFYASWDWRFLFLLFVTMIVDFYVAAYLEKLEDEGAPERKRKAILSISMICNLVILGFFKYFNFFAGSLEVLLQKLGIHVSYSTLNIILPIGISFYTFQSMSYTIDVYRGELRAAKRFLDFALFVSFFPHLVAGPIMRAVDLLPQVLKPRKPTREQVIQGIHLMLWGFWKKVFVADNLAPIVGQVFANPSPTGFQVVIAVYAFAWQIYCDFSGYTDIARGVAKLMGFELVLNFNLPYFSTNPKEFWTRWHISLSSWLRNYLYFPLGGNRGTTAQVYRNLMVTMILGGLWHGAAWNFVLWGFYQGALLVAHRALEPTLDKLFDAATPIGRGISLFVRIVVMFQLTCYGWLLFRAQSFAQIVQMTRALLHPLQGFDEALMLRVAAFATPLFLIQCVQYFSGRLEFLSFRWMPMEFRFASYAVILYFVLFRAAQPQAFIYFQF